MNSTDSIITNFPTLYILLFWNIVTYFMPILIFV